MQCGNNGRVLDQGMESLSFTSGGKGWQRLWQRNGESRYRRTEEELGKTVVGRKD